MKTIFAIFKPYFYLPWIFALAFSNKLFQGTEQNKEEKPYWSSLAN